MGAHKKFDEQLYRENNPQAVAAVINHICTSGRFAGENKEKYGPDLIVYASGFRKVAYIEVEVKHGWRAGQDTFPFPTVNLTERKGHYTRKRLPIEYWILRSDLAMAIIIPESLVVPTNLVEVPNRLIAEGEYFYQVPVGQCILIGLEGGSHEN